VRRARPGRIPWGLVALASVGVVFFALPLVGLVARVPWAEIPSVLTDPVALEALRLSLLASLGATLISLVVGVPLAWVLARVEFPGQGLVRGLVLLPLVLPPVVGGAALLFALGRSGLVGAPLYEATGLVLPFSMSGLVVAVTFVSMPFLVVTAEAGFRNLDRRYETAAEGLGAGSWTVLRRVTLPLAYPALLAGSVLTWARALGEFGATITFAGNLPGETQTLPLAVFVALEGGDPAAEVLSLLMVAISLLVLLALRDRWLTSR
jgi:molybdate transport system permease protein